MSATHNEQRDDGRQNESDYCSEHGTLFGKRSISLLSARAIHLLSTTHRSASRMNDSRYSDNYGLNIADAEKRKRCL
jgi:hypothetical protein